MEVIEGKAFIKGRLRKAAIGIEDGKIVAIKKVLYGKTRNYGNMLILPSGVDIHVHFRQPGYEYKEDFSTGSKAALLAGITCVVDMPNNRPAIVTDEAFKEKLRRIKDRSYVDYALYAGLTENLVKEANLYKLYMSGDNEIFVDYDLLEEMLKNIDIERDRVKAVFHVGHPLEMLLKTIEEENIDMVVMGPKGRTDLRHVLVGSVAEKMFRHCPVPLVSYRMK